ncbi:phage tail protein, partial [Pelagibacterium lentulum]
MPFLAPIAAALIGGGFATQLLVGTAFAVGGALLSQAMAPKPPKQVDPGVSLNLRLGGNEPLSFLVGTTAVAGHRVYAGTWGQVGETPNAYLVDVLEIANLPVDGYNGVFVNGEWGTIRWNEPHSEFGYPVNQGRKGGKDHLWVKFYDGRQTVPDAYLRNRFGNHPDRPYTEDMVGRGNAYVIVTVRYNRELWQNGAPSILSEVRGLRCYDLRKDSTVGGSGAHRRNNPETWEWTANPYVIAYNAAFMGVYFGSEWVWGLQNLPALRLPQSAWIAAMNEADRTLAAWDNQKQFTIGGEITVDMEPAAVLEEIARSSMGRFIESAGSYKPRCGAPGTSVWSFGEGELLITDPRTITPFPGLENTHNYVEVSYSEPGEAWGPKAAPAQTNAAYVTADGNRKLSAGLNLPMVNRNEQAQRLAYSYLEDGRRFRMFQASFHPITWLLEPGDVIDGTILSEGYNGKQFEILEMSGRRTFVQTMTLREIDPSDFDPPASAKQPWSVGPIHTIYPPAQPATGVSFAPYIFFDNEANARRPGIEAFYQGGMDDIEYFRVQVRWPGSELPFFDGEFAYRDDIVGTASQPIFSTSFVPNADLEVRGKYVPFSARETDWTSWLAVPTPDIKLGPLDVIYGDIDLDELGKQVEGLLDWMGGNIRDVIEQAQAQAVLTGDQELANAMQFDELRRSLGTVVGDLSAT